MAKPEIHRLVDNFITEYRARTATPVIILAGTDYTGIPTADVFKHVKAAIAEEVAR
jgi:hypothetical protein